MLDWWGFQSENTVRGIARYAAGIAAIKDYDDAGPEAELHSPAEDERDS